MKYGTTTKNALHAPLIICLINRCFHETPASFLRTLHYFFVDVSFSNFLAEFLQNLLLKSNHARWYVSNEHGIARLPMRSQESIAVAICSGTDLFSELALRLFFHLFIYLLCLNRQAAQFFGRMWYCCRKFHLARQRLCCWVSRFEQLISDLYFDTCPALVYNNSRLTFLVRTSIPNDTCALLQRGTTGGAHPCRSHLRLHSS